MIYILILLVLLFALWAAHEKGQDAGYRRGYNDGVMSGGEGMRKIIEHRNKR